MKQINQRLGVLMDDIATIKPHKDSSFAMMLEAQRRGYDVYTFDANDLFVEQDQVFAAAGQTRVIDQAEHYFEKSPAQVLPLGSFEVILMRKDPPFNMDYIYATYLLEQAEKQGSLVINKPSSLRDANEKLFTLNFAHCMPATLVSSQTAQLANFIQAQQTAVIKPLDGMGGADIFKLQHNDTDINEKINYLTDGGQHLIMAQEFLPEIVKGDKRILLINGEPIDYALARIPAEGNFKGNLAAGATGVGQPLSDSDRYLCTQVGDTLRQMGLMFVGMDVIGDRITEINVTSPTCIRELDAQFGLNIAAELFDAIEQQLGA